jgi:MATE family multidrug resistance protein
MLTERNNLSRFTPGSMREIWALTWPLMLAYLSWSTMLFTDRWFLAKFDAFSFNASATGGTGYWLVAVIPVAIAGVSEVIVGRLNGSNQQSSLGLVFWASLLFSLALVPIALILALIGPSLLFYKDSMHEIYYFVPLVLFMPFQVFVTSLNGLFVGIGKVKIITYTTVVGALVNIVLDYWLIFGGLGVPALGIIGAALGTGLSQLIQAAILAVAVCSSHNDSLYNTTQRPQWLHLVSTIKEFIQLGLPLGLGQWIETFGHFYFFKLMQTMGPEHVTLTAIAQSFYLLLIFIGSSINKTAATVSANALGANRTEIIPYAIYNCLKLIFIFAGLVTAICLLAPKWLLSQVLTSTDYDFFCQPEWLIIARWTLLAFSVFFLFDGVSWILQGVLTAYNDTKIIMWVNTACYWLGVVAPLYFMVNHHVQGAQWGWGLLALSAMLASGAFALRCTYQFRLKSKT